MKIISVTKEFIFGDDREFDSSHGSTLLELRNGEVLAAWFAGSYEKGADTAIWAAARRREGWERPRKICDARGTAMWNPVLFRKPDGTIVLYYKVGDTIEQWQTWYVESGDEGETFSSPRELVPGDKGGRGPVKNKPIVLKDGTIVAPASLEGTVWDAFADLSTDNGATWERSAMVPVRRAVCGQMLHRPYNPHCCYGKGLIQPTLWQDRDGDVHMLLRTTSSRVFRSDSADGGRTWSLAYDTGLPGNNSGLDLTALPDGGLVLAYNPRENLPNYYKGPRTPLVLAYSADNGDTFQEIAVLEDGEGAFAYPSIICGKGTGEPPGADGAWTAEVMVTYTWKRERIAFCRVVCEM